MNFDLEFFGPLQDQIKNHSVRIDTETAPDTIEGLIELVAPSGPEADALRATHVRLAINDRMVSRTATLSLSDGDRIAFMSPFSGG